MPKLIIDNEEVVVPEGTNVLEAAKSIGIVIPHFCYHEALGSVGACRLCAVKFQEGPVKGLQMSCMIEACDGMVVSTTDPEAVKMRSLVIEWLMSNHPHDCPVCDEGGECLLQEMTIAGGHSLRRYRGKKRTFQDQNLGSYIHHEMNRCITCYRCSRFYQEYAGGKDFGSLGSANHVYFGRFQEGAFESPFSGNILDICPTGVFTDKTARYQARWWDYQLAPSICPVCSLGCSIFPIARYRELLKIIPRYNETVNGYFICDLGRFSQEIVNGQKRIQASIFKGKEIPLGDAIHLLAHRFVDLMKSGRGQSVGLLCSPRATLETQIFMRSMAEALETPWLSYFSDPEEESKTRAAVALNKKNKAISMRELEEADLVIVVGTDLLKEAPMMALAIRQAFRKGGRVYVIHSKEIALPFSFESIEKPDQHWKGELERILRQPVSQGDQSPQKKVNRKASIVIGTDSCSEDILRSAAELAQKYSDESREITLSFVLKSANSFGAALLSSSDQTWASMAEAIQSGTITALLCVESDISAGGELKKALTKLDFLAIADHAQQELHQKAHLTIPTTTYAEMSGTYINQEGRAQGFLEVMEPGLRIRALDPQLHPPREFRIKAPGGDIIPAEELLRQVLKKMGKEKKELFTEEWTVLKDLDPESSGILIFDK
jgi:NADH-quinone oxidoreductase subunit G